MLQLCDQILQLLPWRDGLPAVECGSKVNYIGENFGVLYVPQESMAQATVLMGSFDQTRDISHFHTEVVLAVSYLWLCPRESAQQCALSGIRQSNQTDICDALQFQDEEGFGSWLPSTQAGYLLLSVCFGWSHLLHDKSIPQSTFPSLCYDQPLPRFCRFSNRILHILFLPLFVFLLIIDVELIFILPKLFILAFSLILFTYLLLTWIGSYIIISV